MFIKIITDVRLSDEFYVISTHSSLKFFYYFNDIKRIKANDVFQMSVFSMVLHIVFVRQSICDVKDETVSHFSQNIQ